jgi:large subunit ribosomal protein LP2
MRHLAAYLLLVSGGNATPSANDVKTLLSSVGVEVVDERLQELITELEGKDVNELIALGKEKLHVGSAPAGAAAAPAASAGSAAPAGKILVYIIIYLQTNNYDCLCVDK